ncbi:DUF1642 domain-containing protein [Enterococcus faecalis]|uniref:DUF1642 domain-containing protein n=1 Tax=Enterococcus faecalis TaxID=1351 RepID=UPI0035CAC6F2
MSVQNLIEKYKNEYTENVKDYNQAVNDRRQELYARFIKDLKQLDEPKKVSIPKTAENFIEESLEIGSDKVDIINSADSFSQEMPDDEFSLWFKSNRDLFVDAVSKGYEEQLYYVKLPGIGYARFGFCIPITESIEGAKKYTKQEIKAIDEAYLNFAVKVEEEQ